MQKMNYVSQASSLQSVKSLSTPSVVHSKYIVHLELEAVSSSNSYVQLLVEHYPETERGRIELMFIVDAVCFR